MKNFEYNGYKVNIIIDRTEKIHDPIVKKYVDKIFKQSFMKTIKEIDKGKVNDKI